MAPSNTVNEYLLDEDVRNRLKAHNEGLVQGLIKILVGQAPEDAKVLWVFCRAKEVELLGAYFKGFQEIDFRDGNVTVADAAVATYSYTDDYLFDRIAKTHLGPDSVFNKTQGGNLLKATADGRIVREDRFQTAKGIVQEKADGYLRALGKKADTAAKPVLAAIRKAERIAPGHEREYKAISRGAADLAVEHQYDVLALTEGE